uniref:Uncharacterized protein n=1 Tax=Photinus pyralis TaxID=7054 RepID=A0A1Y1KV41_PHOPY
MHCKIRALNCLCSIGLVFYPHNDVTAARRRENSVTILERRRLRLVVFHNFLCSPRPTTEYFFEVELQLTQQLYFARTGHRIFVDVTPYRFDTAYSRRTNYPFPLFTLIFINFRVVKPDPISALSYNELNNLLRVIQHSVTRDTFSSAFSLLF